MKHYRKIENFRENDIELSKNVVRRKNTGSFEIGDKITVQEKIDGSCTSIQFMRDGSFSACSRRQVLSMDNNLNGFYHYAAALNDRLRREIYKDVPFFQFLQSELKDLKKIEYLKDLKNYQEDLIFFGEWTGKRNNIVYNPNPMRRWFVFDIYSIKEDKYLDQRQVRDIAELLKFDYVNTYIDEGTFLGWEYVKPYADPELSAYGDMQEGIIIKNLTKIGNPEHSSNPYYLKIVNEDYRESKVKKNNPGKSPSPEDVEMMERISEIATPVRIEKCLTKLQEDGIVASELSDKELSNVFKVLPRAVVEDCQKEEPVIMANCGKQGRKKINRLVVNYIKAKLL